MTVIYKTYWRKTGLKKNWGELFLNIVNEHKPKVFLEVGVFCGVTARNVCELLKEIHKNEFRYVGIDLFGEKASQDEVTPNYLNKQKFSNPLKNLFYNFLLRKNLNSYESVQNFLKNFSKNVTLIKGNSNIILRNLDLKDIDFVFLDGGHSFETVFDDLNSIYKKISSNKGAVILCDDYEDATYITGVKKAVDKFVEINKLKLILIKKRFAKIII
ncbi:MAG: class I SAM-dependent methyltransferase [Pelagibacteraceae bacterium]|nr:class I SAM-dependent methyltransferase [Pelagibacteraceae bacterium]